MIAFDLIKLAFNDLVSVPLVDYHQKQLCFTFLMLKRLFKNPGLRVVFLREEGIVAATFFVEYLVAFVEVGQTLVEVVVCADASDLVSDITVVVVVVVDVTDVAFDDYIVVCVAVEVDVVAGLFVIFVVAAVVDDAGFHFYP